MAASKAIIATMVRVKLLMQEKMAEIVLLILTSFIMEVIGVIGLTWLLFIKSRSSIPFKEFVQMRLEIIIMAFIIALIGDILIIIFALK